MNFVKRQYLSNNRMMLFAGCLQVVCRLFAGCLQKCRIFAELVAVLCMNLQNLLSFIRADETACSRMQIIHSRNRVK